MPKTADGSILDKDGRLIFCSPERFLSHIVEGEHCFICDRTEDEVPFNREHVLPNWLLRQFDLHGKTVTLPNSTQHGYGSYTIPCCEECNTRLGDIFETPISEAFADGFQGVEALVMREGTERLFRWLALIFLKLHLKDKRLRMYRDRRLGDAPISESYEWQYFHHLHCLVRAHYTGARIGDFVMGSMILMQLVPDPKDEPFDLGSISDARTLFLRAGDIALFAVFNDGQASTIGIEPILSRITGPLSPIQARELAAELAAASLHLENPPQFSSTMADLDGTDLEIVADLDPAGPRFLEKNASKVGFLKHFTLGPFLDNVTGKSREECVELLRQNRLSFLFDDDGNFMPTRSSADAAPVDRG